MIEVFKTNVQDNQTASFVIDLIHRNFNCCNANFDLQDCDNILRVISTEEIDACDLIELLRGHKVFAEVLPDEIIADENMKQLVKRMEQAAIEHSEITAFSKQATHATSLSKFEKLRLN